MEHEYLQTKRGEVNFGKDMYFDDSKIAPLTIDILKCLYDFSQAMEEDWFNLHNFREYMELEHPEEIVVDAQVAGSIFNNLIRKEGLKKKHEHAGRGTQQEYALLSNQFILGPDPNRPYKFKKGYDSRRGRGRKKVDDVTKPIDDAPKVLTLEDAQKMGDMDIAFIGYSIVKEIEASTQMIKTLEADNKKLKEDVTKEEIFKLKIQDMDEKHERKVKDLKEEISNLTRNVSKLNNQILQKNVLIERYETSQKSYNTGQSTFKMGDLARIKNGKPSHLQRP